MTSTKKAPKLADLLAWLERLRGRGQVVHDDKQHCWHVLGHPEASAVLSDPGAFSSDLSGLVPRQEDFALFEQGTFVRMDPPRHRKLRGLVNQAFTPRVVALLEPRIAQVTNELLDGAGGETRVDLIERLAYPLPVIVIAELLGIPASDRPIFHRWADDLFNQQNIDPEQSLLATATEQMDTVVPTIREMNTYLLQRIRARRADLADDLMSKLILAEVDGEHLADEEIIGFVGLLLLAGHITTTATLGNAILCFEENPEAAAAVRDDPGLLPDTIEEVLRYRTPFSRLARLTTRGVRTGEVDIPAGAVVMPWLAAANRDERVFTEPNRFDVHRTRNPHLAFGHGIHFCIGAPLARLEARVALGIMFQRYADISVAADEPVEEVNPWLMTSVNRLPLDLRPN
ncbi:cytochrome P450 [Actinoplanes capillaceus]|uniref:Cytochrome P450 n=1 Tax=Actinoplanes campanulatus TaxID=113559 RepID=A0ABQ3W913_9ACTN|nr:cytochrome P450 [Actinoplanes capillaceus]GID42780.1 cytochrome P450 [Actinoplanes capillaceus]